MENGNQKKSKDQKIIILLLILLILTIISCTVIVVLTVTNDQKITSNETQDDKSNVEMQPTSTPEATTEPEIILNELGIELTENLRKVVFYNFKNCCDDNGEPITDEGNPIVITDPPLIKKYVAEIQKAQEIQHSDLPSGLPMEFLGGVSLNFYYADNTYSSLWFLTENYMVLNKKFVGNGSSSETKIYYLPTTELYIYLNDQYNALINS